ncbi:hypothetical protein FLL45_18420 [Aliikangiella marina]|uniref:DUF4097 domain-containing protein n=1 Tax=Aliikangiella marina TaxID=1712262 RepID=A0A545T4T1_9GAMM|nr:hypothetical protein [Aliikangiella marina]TQV72195.1 hypothetical protein FLL45_18420 [Aliikangiella marina]
MKKCAFIHLMIVLLSIKCSAAQKTNDQLLNSESSQSQLASLEQAKQLAHEMKSNQSRKFELKSFDWNGEIPQSRLVVLNNPFGSIRSRNHLEQKVFMHATIQEIGDNPLTPEFRIREVNHQLFIDVVYDEKIKNANGEMRGRVDIAILFPGDVSIVAKTDFGLIKIDKTESHVQAESNSGNIKLTTTGLFSAKTVSGQIDLRMRGFKEFGLSSAESRSGKITASIFSDMELLLSADSKQAVLLNGEQKASGIVYSKGKQTADVDFKSYSGEIIIEVVDPPALVQSVKPSSVNIVNLDLRDLPKAKPWKPGDPVYDRDDKRINNRKP